MKICLFGTQRCGSQYVSELIHQILSMKALELNEQIYASYHIATNLHEPFSYYRYNKKILTNTNGLLRVEDNTSDSNNYENYHDHVDAVLEKIKRGSKKQSVVLKLFFLYYDEDTIRKIVTTLKNCGYEFMQLKRRDVEKQILSFIIANHTDGWFQGTKEMVKITNLDTIDYMADQIKRFDIVMKMLGMENVPTIYYESVIDDLKRYFVLSELQNQTLIQKAGWDNPYDQIENVSEVRERICRII